MNITSTAFALLAQVAAETGAAPSSGAGPWYREPWGLWLITAATLAVPTLVAWVLAKQFRAADMWGRIAAVLVALAAGSVICWLGWPPRLGIDLKGGLILVYEVDTSKQSQAEVDDCIRRIEELATQEGREASIARGTGGRVTVSLKAADAVAREAFLAAVRSAQFDRVEVREAGRRVVGDVLEADYDLTPLKTAVAMDKLVAAVSRRVNPGGQKEVTVRQYGLDQIEVILPEVEQSEVDMVKRIVSSAGVLEFRILANREDPRHQAAIALAARSVGNTVSDKGEAVARWVRVDPAKMNPAEDRRLVARSGAEGGLEVLVMIDRLNVTGGDLGRVSSGTDESLNPSVDFTFKSSGAGKFGYLTSTNKPNPANGVESRLGIVLDDVVQSAPVIRSMISTNGQITGNFKQADVDVLVEVLNAGSLPAALRSEPISEQRISSQLGDDTIKSAKLAMLLATIVVLTFMLAYYRFSGFVADLAVLLNIVLVVAAMISLKAAFTLAGLAGLVLSVGMAVDANVLIYERMREELDRGAAVRMAIRNGFQRAFSTIVDSNLTTLITAVVLFAIGTDQLKGFAVTLFFGLLLNLFTAVFCSRVVFELAERNRWITRLSMARLFGATNFRFVAWMKPAIVASMLFILVGLLAGWQRGKGLFDIDFTGGSSVQLEFKEGKGLDVAAVREAVKGLPNAAVSAISTAGEAEGLRYKVDTSQRDGQQGEGGGATVEQTLREAFGDRLATYGMAIKAVETVTREPDGAEKPAAGGAAAVQSTEAKLEFPQKIGRSTLEGFIRAELEKQKIGDADYQLACTRANVTGEGPCAWTLTTTLDPESTKGILAAVQARLSDTPVYLAANEIGGKVAGNTQVTAVYALFASLVMIVIYVWVRFQNMAFGLAAVVALAHDVLVAVSCLALSKFVAPFMGWALVDDFKISLDVVAALLTIIGFSINDTIVIFDRLRELRGKSRFVSAEMVDRAVNQTLSRTILTSGTALLATMILYAYGGQGIHAFAFTMLVGIITGTYSTIYIASPIVLWLQYRTAGAGAREGGRSPAAAQPV